MKTARVIISGRKSQHGAALLLVLGSLVLLGALLLAFLGGVKGNLKTTKLYADGSSVRTLADSAVNLVMAQINQATADADKTWASQPGMIRVFSVSGSEATACYKLYSWDNLKTGGNFNAAANSVPENWHAQKALFTDLNAPLTTGTTRHFPILNPPQTAAIELSVTGTMRVEGFAVTNAPLDTAADSPNPVPMPVKWLYVLQNGEIIAPTSASAGSVTVSGATPSNPIVGRIAFWTDDETCKVNINTASEGAFWSTPLAEDGFSWYVLAKRQPTQREYQRYPGHPATVSLSTVFSSALPVTMPTISGYGDQSTYNAVMPKYAEHERYYRLSPKLNKSNSTGSKAGTIQATGSISVRDDRLYASIEELQFLSNLPSDQSSAGYDPAVPAFSGSVRAFSTGTNNTALIDETALQKAKFFITTSNRSPDVNMFNKPRIVTWPVHKEANKRTLFDRVLAFCGTINNSDYYYFQRERADSQTNDLDNIARNRQLLAYLSNLTGRAVPGYGGSFAAKYGADHEQILTEIFDYIRCLNLRDQSESNSFQFAKAANWASDLPRGKSAGAGQVVPIYNAANDTRGFGRFPAVQEAALIFIATGWRNGSATVPTAAGDINWISDNADQQWPARKFDDSGSRGKYGFDETLPKERIAVQAGLFFNFFDPSNGFPSNNGSYRIKVSGLLGLRLNGSPLFAEDSLTSMPPSNYGGKFTYTAGGNLGFRFFSGGYKTKPSDAADLGYYPFLGVEIPVPYTPPATVPPADFTGGTLTVEIQVPNATSLSYAGAYETVQTFEINFASIAAMPVPTYPRRAKGASKASHGNWGNRMDMSDGDGQWSAGAEFIVPEDVVRSVRATPGDMRIIAGRKTIRWGDELYGSFPEYNSSTERFAHSLMEAGHFPFYGAILGQLVKGLKFGGDVYNQRHVLRNGATDSYGLSFAVNAGGMANTSAANPPTQTGAYLKVGGNEYPGDWDNGVGYMPDGAYINKADGGTLNQNDLTGDKTPYFVQIENLKDLITPTFFSPNRMMPSPVMFGSLSTGVKRNLPWQTLLFCPNPAAGDNHPGFATPPDHVLLDLFHMPVVEPYPISEPLSTDGRVNMNYQIVPFTYIERSTAVRAVLKQQRMFTAPDNMAARFKQRESGNIGENDNQPIYGLNCWPLIDVNKTLGGFKERFDRNEIFRSASEICSLFLYPAFKAAGSAPDVPAEYNTDAIKRFWQGTAGNADGHKITGDNGRERPYTALYPLLTTKSNTYQVHLRVQKLQKNTALAADTWTEGRDQILAEYRGAAVIERYVDPNDPRLPDFAANLSATLNPYYKFRVLRSTQFAP